MRQITLQDIVIAKLTPNVCQASYYSHPEGKGNDKENGKGNDKENGTAAVNVLYTQMTVLQP